MKFVTVIGNRPQFVKLAAVSPLLRREHDELLVHTGQHHDRQLSEIFFDQLKLPKPEIDLGIAGGSNNSQVSRMLAELDSLLMEVRPDAVIVYGDTNSTLAAALAAVGAQIPLVHVEAGLRSFDRAMPEEVNRVVCDALGDLLLAPSDNAEANLAREGASGKVVVTGDVMGDVVLRLGGAIDAEQLCAQHGIVAGEFLLFTAHRAANVDTPERLNQLVDLLEALDQPVLFPVHPRTRQRLVDTQLIARLERKQSLQLLPPLGYLETIALAGAARAVVTDSGGLQKEAVWLGTQCVTLRPTTEWVETVESGWNTLVDLDPAMAASALASGPPGGAPPDLYGAGRAGAAVVAALEHWNPDSGTPPIESTT